MILVSKTYIETTPESTENGENSDSGFIFENAECTFKELVKLMREHPEPSCNPCQGYTFDYFSTYWSVDDYTTMTERQTSIHYSHKNPEKNAKYWSKAARAAGLVKG